MKDLETAKARLSAGQHTCVLCYGQQLYTSRDRGVKPLVRWYAAGMDFSDFSAADKVVGKATAFLYVLLGVKAVYARVISRGALDVLNANGIAAAYDDIVEYIVNRRGDGMCPFEQAVMDAEDPAGAYCVIRSKMKELKIEL